MNFTQADLDTFFRMVRKAVESTVGAEGAARNYTQAIGSPGVPFAALVVTGENAFHAVMGLQMELLREHPPVDGEEGAQFFVEEVDDGQAGPSLN